MSALAEFQNNFSRELLGPDSSTSLRLGAGFAVYQNTVMKGLVDALQANYPTVEQLVGAEWLQAAALIHAREHLPGQPSLALYGESFAEFLAQFAPARELPYLAPVARIDRLWTEAHFAVDEAALSAMQLAALPPQSLQDLQLQLHPATRFAWLPHSATTIWQHNRPPALPPESLQIDDVEEGVLITRPGGEVQVQRIGYVEFKFLQLIQVGNTLGEATIAMLADDARVDIAVLLASMIGAGAFAAHCKYP